MESKGGVGIWLDPRQLLEEEEVEMLVFLCPMEDEEEEGSNECCVDVLQTAAPC